jgi:hypothetical protein
LRGSAHLETARNQAELMRKRLVPVSNDLAPAFVLSQAVDLRLRGDPTRRSRCSPTP